jgi:hypothetical protein
VRKTLDVWPSFLPIYVSSDGGVTDNIIAALEHSHRVDGIYLHYFPNRQLDNALAKPFPALKRLRIESGNGLASVDIPAWTLGGPAPRLQHLFFDQISFLGLPKLLLSATHLVRLILRSIPHSGYISPEEMVPALSALTRLERLTLEFDSWARAPQYLPYPKTPPPPTRALLPVLTKFQFIGVSGYLEDLVAWIDAPLLNHLKIILLHQVVFDTPQLTQFISRTPNSRHTIKRWSA